MIDPGAMQAVDPRVKLGAVLLLGVALWSTGWLGLLLCAAILAPVLAAARHLRADAPRLVRGFMIFTLFWSGVKLGLGLWNGVSLSVAVPVALFFGFRLLLLLLVGLALALTTSARQIGKSLSWALRPVLGRERAWRPALALSLMIHFIPQCMEAVGAARRTLAMRFPNAPLFRKMVLLPQMILRFMGQKTWDQTLAVTVRGLDDAAAWEADFHWSFLDSLAAFVLGSAVLAIFLL